jgi:hypothetical protein
MVSLLTLDQSFGVRIPVSQPLCFEPSLVEITLHNNKTDYWPSSAINLKVMASNSFLL